MVERSDDLEVETVDVSEGGQRFVAAIRARKLPRSARRAAQARAWLSAATSASEAQRLADAESAARAGLDALASDYLDPDDSATDDDTEMKVLGADATEDAAQRVTLLTRMLEARLVMYRWRYSEEDLQFDPPIES